MAAHGDSKIDPLKPLLPKAGVDRITEPIRQFLHIPSASGLVLLACTGLALVLANSPWAGTMADFWHTSCEITIGNWSLKKDLLHVVNDGLMAIFFFLVGLEIKREIVAGELRDPRQAVLPIVAAIGGMVVPALMYLGVGTLVGLDESSRRGWAIPMATDIAFVVGLLALFGNRIPLSLKILLLTLAIVDDLGAVLMIALVFTETIHTSALIVAVAGTITAVAMRLAGVRRVPLYVVVGVVVWLMVLKSGVHPTIAGVLLGLMTPASPWITSDRLSEILETGAQRLQASPSETARAHVLARVEFAAREGISPRDRLERALHLWVVYGIMPFFAFANAGVPIKLSGLGDPVAIAVAAGLVIGKPVGILAFMAMAIATGIAKRPAHLGWGALTGGACLAGIGFTMSLFLAGLALPESALDAGKIGTLLGSLISSVLGLGLLVWFTRPSQAPAAESV
jgi:NhaA family Na+:H+ antiporter